MTIEDPSFECPWLPIVTPSKLVSKWVIIRNLMFQTYFEVFYSLLVEGSL